MNEDCLLKFGKKLKKLREDRGLTQEALALAIDVDKSYIRRIEREERNPNLKVIISIANDLNVPIKSLFDFDDIE